jgi:hypothetical protein
MSTAPSEHFTVNATLYKKVGQYWGITIYVQALSFEHAVELARTCLDTLIMTNPFLGKYQIDLAGRDNSSIRHATVCLDLIQHCMTGDVTMIDKFLEWLRNPTE